MTAGRRDIAGLRILFVVPNVPSPVRVRPYSLISRLSRHHEVHVICLQTEVYEQRFVEELARTCRTLTLVRLSKGRGRWNCLRALASDLPLRLAYFFSPAAEAQVRAAISRHRFDLVHVEHAKSIRLARQLLHGDIPVVCDSVDCLSLYLERQLRSVRNVAYGAFVATELRKMRRFEAKHYRSFDRVLVSSSIDAAYIESLSRGSVSPIVVPNGVDREMFPYQRDLDRNETILFAAKLDYFPNAQAALYLAREILPLVWRRRPRVRLRLVGNNPPASVRALASPGRVEVTGYVEDVSSYLAEAAIAMAPIRTKAGTQFKILEAMAVGTPVVATRLACQGLDVTDGTHLLAGDDAEELANKVVLLLENPKLGERLAKSGHEYVCARHDWDNITDQLEGVYAELVTSRR